MGRPTTVRLVFTPYAHYKHALRAYRPKYTHKHITKAKTQI